MRDLIDFARLRHIPAAIIGNPRLLDIATCMPEQAKQIVRDHDATDRLDVTRDA